MVGNRLYILNIEIVVRRRFIQLVFDSWIVNNSQLQDLVLLMDATALFKTDIQRIMVKAVVLY